MKIAETFSVAAPRDRVWEFITSPDRVAPCLPGCEGVEDLGDGKYKATIKVQMGPIKTKFKVDVEEKEQRPPEFASYTTRGEEGGRASRVSAESTLELRAIDDNTTEVAYVSEVSIVGRLGKFGLGVMKKRAAVMGEEFANAMRAEIEA